MAFRRSAALTLVLLSTLGAAAGALAVFTLDRHLSVGTVRLSTDPGHAGALDIYVPLVDWGVRFDAVRLPARLSLDVRSLDRKAVAEVARGRHPDVEALRHEAEDAIGAYVRLVLAVAAAASLALGVLMALALRGRAAPLRLTLPAVGAGVLLASLAIVFLLPPRGAIEDPEYYANGPDIPAALRAIDQASGTAERISQELNDQLVGLARLIAVPSGREGATELPHLTLASDLHNNLLALPTLERAVRQGPLFFAGDLTSSGSPFEAALTRRVASIGDPFVFVTGNHDSDVLARRLAAAGAIVLTQRGRLLADGRLGDVVVNVGGLRVAGYSDPFERRRRDGYRNRGSEATDEQKRAFAEWLHPLLGRVDLIMTHEPALTDLAAQELRDHPPARPLAILTGHTHVSSLHISENLVELNGGTVGGGGTGNLDKNQPFGLAELVRRRSSRFLPLLADIVEIDAESGAAKAERTSLDLTGRR